MGCPSFEERALQRSRRRIVDSAFIVRRHCGGFGGIAMRCRWAGSREEGACTTGVTRSAVGAAVSAKIEVIVPLLSLTTPMMTVMYQDEDEKKE
jgi:hypothetical protein